MRHGHVDHQPRRLPAIEHRNRHSADSYRRNTRNVRRRAMAIRRKPKFLMVDDKRHKCTPPRIN